MTNLRTSAGMLSGPNVLQFHMGAGQQSRAYVSKILFFTQRLNQEQFVNDHGHGLQFHDCRLWPNSQLLGYDL